MINDGTLEKKVKSLEERVLSLENLVKGSTTPMVKPGNKKKSPKEFLLEKKPKDDLQRTLYLAYYLEKYNGLESFGVDEMRDAFRSARVSIPANLNDKVNKNISKGYLMDTKSNKKGKKAWILTATGESYVENSEKQE